MSRLYAASTLLFLLPHGLAVPVNQDLPSFQLLNATAPAVTAPTSTGDVTAFAAPLIPTEPLDVPGTLGQPIEPGIGDGTGPEAYSIPPTPEVPAAPHTLSVTDLASIIQQLTNVISSFFTVVPGTTSSSLKSRQLSGLSGNALGGLVQTLLSLVTELLDKVPLAGDVSSKLPLATATGVLGGLGKEKRDVSGLPIGVVTGLAQELLALVTELLGKVPVAGGVVSSVPLSPATGVLGGLGKEKRDVSGLPTGVVLGLVQELLPLITSLLSNVPVAGGLASNVPLSTATGVLGGLGKEKRDVPALPIGVVTDLVQTVLGLLNSILGGLPVVGGVTNTLPLGTATNVLGGLGKRNTLTAQQQELFDVATARNAELKEALQELKATQQSHLQSEKRQLPGLDITSLLSIVTSLLDTVLGLTKTLPVGSVTGKLPVDPTSVLTGLGGRAEKRQLGGLDLTSLLNTVVSLLDTALGLAKTVPVAGGAATGLTGSVSGPAGTVESALPLGAATGLTGSLGPLGTGIGGTVGKRQLPSTDVASSLLPTVLSLLNTVLGIFKDLPVAGGVVGSLPTSSLGGRAENPPHVTDFETPTPHASKAPHVTDIDAPTTPTTPTLKSILKMFLGLIKGTPGASKLNSELSSNSTSTSSRANSSVGGQPEKRQLPNLDATTLLLSVVTELISTIVKLTSSVPVAGPIAGTVTSKIPGNPVSVVTGTLGSLGGRSGPIRARQVLNNFGGLGGLTNIAKPATDATKPLVQVAKPLTAAASPVVGAAQPVVAVASPVAAPALGVVSPALGVVSPALNAPAPATEITKPIVGAASPALAAAAPAVDAAEPVLAAAAPVTDIAKTVIPFDLLQTVIKLISTLLSLDLGSATAPLTTRSESIPMGKGQLPGPGFVKDFILQVYKVGQVFDSLSPDDEAQLEDILSDPTLDPNDMPDMEGFPTVIRTFILEYITFLQVLSDPTVPIEDKYENLDLLINEDYSDEYRKRSMRSGLRKRQDAAPAPDEGPSLDDAPKLGKAKLDSILGPDWSLDPLGQMTDVHTAEAQDSQDSQDSTTTESDSTTSESDSGDYAPEPLDALQAQDSADVPSPPDAKDAGPPEVDDATIDPPEDASRNDWAVFDPTSIHVATPADVQGGIIKYPWEPNTGVKDGAEYPWNTADGWTRMPMTMLR